MKINRMIVLLPALLLAALLLTGCGSQPLADNVSPSPKPTPAEKASPSEKPEPAKEETMTEEASEPEDTPQPEEPLETEEPGRTKEESTLVINTDDGDQVPQALPEDQTLPRYKVTVSDLSWSKARAACWDQGGYLAVISSREELDEIAALAEDQGLSYVWIGCHREDKTLVWENDETVDYFNWASGEPSQIDSYDYVREDFIMLKREGDSWYYNDNRDDPAGYFPEFYSGVMGFVCEFDR